MLLASWGAPLGWTLLHSLWQGALLAFGLRLVLRTLPSHAASVRYVAACGCLIGMLVLPVLTTLTSQAPSDSTAAGHASALHVGTDAWTTTADDGTVPTRALSSDGATRSSESGWDAARMTFVRLLPMLAAAWLVGVSVLLVRLAGGWWLTRRLIRSALPAPREWQATLERLATAMRIGQRVVLRCTPRVSAPVLLGCWRPLILVPTSALTGLAPWQLELLLRHELAHVRRLDPWVNMLQSVAEVLLFHHPAARWVSACISSEREHCCDDLVAADAGAARYVRALVAMEELRTVGVASPRPVGLGADGGSLLGRVHRLLGTPPTTRARARGTVSERRIGLAVVMLCVVLGIVRERRAGGEEAPAAGSPTRPTQFPLPAGGSLAATCANAAAHDAGALCAPLRAQLAALLRDRGYEGSVVVQDVATGAVVAFAATSPTREASVAARRTPGSVWKLALAAIWFDEGLGARRVPCPATLTLGGQTLRHWGTPRAAMTASEMLVASCNTAAALMALELRDRLGADGMRAALARLGFGELVAPAAAGSRDGNATFWGASPTPWQRRLEPEDAIVGGDRWDGERRRTHAPRRALVARRQDGDDPVASRRPTGRLVRWGALRRGACTALRGRSAGRGAGPGRRGGGDPGRGAHACDGRCARGAAGHRTFASHDVGSSSGRRASRRGVRCPTWRGTTSGNRRSRWP
ncbi:MAG: penicillin-binding transpeptidase domain-containing protein [Gemmatimonadaceae bacterium]|nr:penicillin-binding transpeptidase domain-containing protein [Gemmatimonadaceae bacterium]